MKYLVFIIAALLALAAVSDARVVAFRRSGLAKVANPPAPSGPGPAPSKTASASSASGEESKQEKEGEKPASVEKVEVDFTKLTTLGNQIIEIIAQIKVDEAKATKDIDNKVEKETQVLEEKVEKTEDTQKEEPKKEESEKEEPKKEESEKEVQKEVSEVKKEEVKAEEWKLTLAKLHKELTRISSKIQVADSATQENTAKVEKEVTKAETETATATSAAAPSPPSSF